MASNAVGLNQLTGNRIRIPGDRRQGSTTPDILTQLVIHPGPWSRLEINVNMIWVIVLKTRNVFVDQSATKNLAAAAKFSQFCFNRSVNHCLTPIENLLSMI